MPTAKILYGHGFNHTECIVKNVPHTRTYVTFIYNIVVGRQYMVGKFVKGKFRVSVREFEAFEASQHFI